MSAADAGEPHYTRIVAIRHGETAWNVDGRLQGHLDIPLNETGRRQARRLADALADEGIDAVVASDLARARETAGIVAAAIGRAVVCDAGLRERCFGVFEGLTHAEIESRWPDDSRRWKRRDPDYAPPGAETLRGFSARAGDAVVRIAAAHPGRTVAIVTHGGVLDCLYRHAVGVDLQAARSWQLGNASVNRLLYAGHRLALVGWGDVRHLDRETLDDDSAGGPAGRGDAPRRGAGSFAANPLPSKAPASRE